MGRLFLAIVLACGLFSADAAAQTADRDEAAIRDALVKWTADFNARNDARICDLFAPELVYDYRGFPERNHSDLCGLLRRSLADRTRQFTYMLDIKEIIVSGDLAVVRLVWTLRTTLPGASTPVESKEPGLDVFRRQPDGGWKIIRYIAY
jgi:ketosteroid isomerase-like protein